jgi:hypothetical protein
LQSLQFLRQKALGRDEDDINILTDTRRFWKSQKSKLLEMGKLEIPAGFPIIKW